MKVKGVRQVAPRNSAVLASCRLISQSPLFNVCQCLDCDILIFSRFQFWLVSSGMANVKEAWKIFRGLLPKPKLRSTCFSTFEIILPWENELRETTQDGQLHPKLKTFLTLVLVRTFSHPRINSWLGVQTALLLY